MAVSDATLRFLASSDPANNDVRFEQTTLGAAGITTSGAPASSSPYAKLPRTGDPTYDRLVDQYNQAVEEYQRAAQEYDRAAKRAFGPNATAADQAAWLVAERQLNDAKTAVTSAQNDLNRYDERKATQRSSEDQAALEVLKYQLGLSRDAQSDASALQRTALQEEGANLRNRVNAYIDLLTQAVQYGSMSRQAAIDALTKIPEFIQLERRLNSPYYPGYEPGGGMSIAYQAMGLPYDPERYRQPPVDLRGEVQRFMDLQLSQVPEFVRAAWASPETINAILSGQAPAATGLAAPAAPAEPSAAAQATVNAAVPQYRGPMTPAEEAQLRELGADLVASGDLTVFQFGEELRQKGYPSAVINSICGPIAAAGIAKAFGADVSLDQFIAQAGQYGWTAERGMAGPDSFRAMLEGEAGIPSRYIDEPAAVAAVQAGVPVAVSTPKHYFLLMGYDEATGKFFVGNTGRALKGGSQWMSADEIRALGGGIQGFILPTRREGGQLPSVETARAADEAGLVVGQVAQPDSVASSSLPAEGAASPGVSSGPAAPAPEGPEAEEEPAELDDERAVRLLTELADAPAPEAAMELGGYRYDPNYREGLIPTLARQAAAGGQDLAQGLGAALARESQTPRQTLAALGDRAQNALVELFGGYRQPERPFPPGDPNENLFVEAAQQLLAALGHQVLQPAPEGRVTPPLSTVTLGEYSPSTGVPLLDDPLSTLGVSEAISQAAGGIGQQLLQPDQSAGAPPPLSTTTLGEYTPSTGVPILDDPLGTVAGLLLPSDVSAAAAVEDEEEIRRRLEEQALLQAMGLA